MDNLTAANQNRYLPLFKGEHIGGSDLRLKEHNWWWYGALVAINALATVIYFVLPAHGNFGNILLGTSVFRHDAVLNAGILEWGFRSIWSPSLRFFDWPAGFPLSNTLPGTENLVGWQLFYSPLRALGANVAASYNATLLIGLVVSGVTTSALAARLGASRPGALLAGFAFAFNPFHLDHMIHLQTMAICWSPLAILGLDMALENGSRAGLAMLGAGFVMTVLSGMYFGVFLSIVMVCYVLISVTLGRVRLSWSKLARLAATAFISVVAIAPVLAHYVEFAAAFGAYPHTGSELALSSLPLASLIQTPAWLLAWQSTSLATLTPGRFASAFPGLSVLLLALWTIAPRADGRHTRPMAPLVLLAVICLVLAFGPTIEWRVDEPVRSLTSFPLPGKIWLAFTAIRWPMRIFMYTALCLSLLAGLGATRLLAILPARWTGPSTLALLALVALELRPAESFSRMSATTVDPIGMSDAYPFLARETDRGGVVEVPSKMDSGMTTPFATRYAYASAGHLRGVVAFHGSMFPALLDSLRRASNLLPQAAAIDMMKSHGVTRVVVHKDLMSRDSSAVLVAAFLNDGDSIVFQSSQSAVFSLIRR